MAVACSFIIITSCGGGNPKTIVSYTPNPSDPSIGLSNVTGFDHNEDVPISQTESEYIVSTGGVDFFLDKNALNLTAQLGEKVVVRSLDSTIKLNGNTISVAPPSESSSGNNWVEFRGWYSQSDNLWYVARYRFWPEKPFVHLAFSVTDRHDDHPTEAHWESHWERRLLSDFKLMVDTDDDLGEQSVVQESAFSGGNPHTDPKITGTAFENEVQWRQERRSDGEIQLVHSADSSGKTFLRIYPRATGKFDLRLKQVPLLSPYPAANSVPVKIVHSGGEKSLIIDQGSNTNKLGEFTLDRNSYVQINAAGEGGDRIVFEKLELTASNGSVQSIGAKRVPDTVFSSRSINIIVKDFWQKFPIEASSEGNRFTLTGVKSPVKLVGGVGLTFDIGLNANPGESNENELLGLMQNPPNPSLPSWWSALDGVYTTEERYASLMSKTAGIIKGNDETSGNYGWMNWGDYQIGNSYFIDGGPTEDWGALQYDLAHGLLMSWLQTGDLYLWNRARASIRNAMDVQIAKFEPYFQKRSGAGIRKGACTNEFHWCQENIPEFNYHTRSLLLYSHLTREQWPKDIAQMVIDNSAYFSLTRPEWTFDHERILSWSLRNLVYGAHVFPEGTKYNSSPEGKGYPVMSIGSDYAEMLNRLVNRTVSEIEDTGVIPGDQPVWGGQIVEGLIIAFESGLLNQSLADRTYNAIKLTISDFVDNNLRKSGGEYEMIYSTGDKDWVYGANYGWFWINSLAWASLNIDAEYGKTFRSMYDWLQDLYLYESEFQTTRAWTGVMGFPSYGASLYENR